MAVNSCLRDMYHYARISGSHVLECVMCAALSYVKKEMLQEANDVGGMNLDLFLLIIALHYRWVPVAPFRFLFSLLRSETVFSHVLQVLTLFPRLRPLVASMGWDMLPGKTAARRKLMRLLWSSNSQAIRLEESTLYGNNTDEVNLTLLHSLLFSYHFLEYDSVSLTGHNDLSRNLVWNISAIHYVIGWTLHLSLLISVLVNLVPQRHLS